jgi:hypothetical protein
MAALDIDNYGEAINWFKQGPKFILAEKEFIPKGAIKPRVMKE